VEPEEGGIVSKQRSGTHAKKRLERHAGTETYPFRCPNCDAEIREAILYCSDLCRDEAKYVRYYRACIADGRVAQPDVQDALEIRLAFLLSGGYAWRERRIPQEVREAVTARDGGRCRVCGAFADEIDHIDGTNSSDPDNLQLLCADCHRAKTLESFVVRDYTPEEQAKVDELNARTLSCEPLRDCDRPRWSTEYRAVLASRRAALKALVRE
jgi:5-methylcytosine-specific restriction endonuclease McrA